MRDPGPSSRVLRPRKASRVEVVSKKVAPTVNTARAVTRAVSKKDTKKPKQNNSRAITRTITRDSSKENTRGKTKGLPKNKPRIPTKKVNKEETSVPSKRGTKNKTIHKSKTSTKTTATRIKNTAKGATKSSKKKTSTAAAEKETEQTSKNLSASKFNSSSNSAELLCETENIKPPSTIKKTEEDTLTKHTCRPESTSVEGEDEKQQESISRPDKSAKGLKPYREEETFVDVLERNVKNRYYNRYQCKRCKCIFEGNADLIQRHITGIRKSAKSSNRGLLICPDPDPVAFQKFSSLATGKHSRSPAKDTKKRVDTGYSKSAKQARSSHSTSHSNPERDLKSSFKDPLSNQSSEKQCNANFVFQPKDVQSYAAAVALRFLLRK